MSPQSAMQLPASGSGVGLAASWTFSSERAVMLGTRSGGFLRVDTGAVWLTLDGPHERRAGDLFLEAGARMPIAAGQRVVLEPVARAGTREAAIDWLPAVVPEGWPAAVAQPAADLRLAAGAAGLALRAAAGAFVRLAGGLLGLLPAAFGFATDWVARRDRGTLGTAAFRAHSSASRAQGCMN